MIKKRKKNMFPPNLSIPNISKKLLFFGAFLLLGFSGYGQNITISDESELEGTDLVFTVTLDVPNVAGTSVTYTFANGTATAADYTGNPGTVTFLAGDDTPQTFTVPIINDAIVEGTETFTITLGTPTGGEGVSGSPATGAITNDDSATLSIVATTQAAEDTTDGLFTITTTNQFSTAVTVDILITGSATQGTDYTVIGTTVNFPANTNSVTIPVEVLLDTDIEGDETVLVTRTPPSSSAAVTTSSSLV